MGFKIIGTGSAAPKRAVTNDDLAKIMDTSDEWIRTRTGICERRILADDETLTDLAVCAGKGAIDMAGISAESVGVVICSTMCGDYITPAVAALAAGQLGVPENAVVLDMNMACSGFIVALNAAEAYLSSGMAKYALVISAEALSRLVDWSDRSTCVLVGDAAGAVVLEASDDIVDFDIKTDGGFELLRIDRRSDNCPYNAAEESGVMRMNGQEVYKFAVSSVTERIESILKRNSLTIDGISRVLLHQANMRINSSAAHRLGGGDEKFPHNIERYGNTSSATIPVLLDELCRDGKLEAGTKMIFCAFGAGMTSAACLIDWHI